MAHESWRDVRARVLRERPHARLERAGELRLFFRVADARPGGDQETLGAGPTEAVAWRSAARKLVRGEG